MPSPFRLILDEQEIGERGTTVAVFDYADALRRYQNVEPIILYNAALSLNKAVLRRFETSFETHAYRSAADRKALVERLKPDRYYYLQVHKRDRRWFDGVETICHAIFDFAPNPLAHRFAYVSQWLSDFMSDGRLPVVPHVVSLPPPAADLRATLAIPSEATVIGRHGGPDTFDIPFVHRAVRRALERRPDLWFVFVNTARFVDHPRALFLPAIVDPQAKADFIGACDLMLHGRRKGESFGLAMAEFLLLGKPVLCWGGGQDRNHVLTQPHPGNIYRTERDLDDRLHTARRTDRAAECRAAVAPFAPEAVAERFAAVFLRSAPPPLMSEPAIIWSAARRKLLNDRSRLRNAAFRLGLFGRGRG